MLNVFQLRDFRNPKPDLIPFFLRKKLTDTSAKSMKKKNSFFVNSYLFLTKLSPNLYVFYSEHFLFNSDKRLNSLPSYLLRGYMFHSLADNVKDFLQRSRTEV